MPSGRASTVHTAGRRPTVLSPPAATCREQSAAVLSLLPADARSRLSLYPHITSTYIHRDKFDQNVNTVCVENNIGR